MKLPHRVEVVFEFIKEYQHEFSTANSLAQKLRAAERTKFLLSEILSEIERHYSPSHYEHKRSRREIEAHIVSFDRYIQSQGRGNSLAPVDCDQLRQQLAIFWGLY